MSLLDWMQKVKSTLDQRRVSRSSSGDIVTAAPEAKQSSAAPEERYDNLGEIARGGMGAILKVRDRGLLRTVAMKVLEPEGDASKDAARAALFAEEAQITSQLDHPNLCPIHEYGRDQKGTHYFTMKLVKGKTLTHLVSAPGYSASDPRKLREAVDVLRKVCDALAFAHAKGVLHRDLKPDNVMVGAYGEVYLMDWGVARLVPGCDAPERVVVNAHGTAASDQAGLIVGTLMYMAPEQARGADVDVRSDVFGVGAILYEVLTQVPPYYAPDVGSLVLQAQGAGWRPPQEMVGPNEPLPAALCAICEKAMAPNPDDRYPDVASLKAALDEFLVGGMIFPTITVEAGTCIVGEGEPGDRAYVLQRGFCRVYRFIDGEQVAIADLQPGDVFGETAVFTDANRMATVQALTEVTLQVVTKDVFEKDLGLASALGSFVKALAKRFVSADNDLRAARAELKRVPLTMAPLTMAPMALPPAPAAAPTSSSTPTPAWPPLPPLPPLSLVDAALQLRGFARNDDEVGALLVDALSRGVRAIAAERSAAAPASATVWGDAAAAE